MRNDGYKLLHVGATVFKVLAWVALVLQVVMGLILLVGGGDPVLIGGLEVPARVVGILNCISAVVYFFMFLLMSAVIRLLLELHARLPQTGSPGR